MKQVIVAIATFLLVYIAAIPAVQAQTRQQLVCGERETLVEKLRKRFGEERVAISTSKGNLVEFFASPKSHTWTMLITRPRGPTCVGGSGGDYYYRPLDKQQDDL